MPTCMDPDNFDNNWLDCICSNVFVFITFMALLLSNCHNVEFDNVLGSVAAVKACYFELLA